MSIPQSSCFIAVNVEVLGSLLPYADEVILLDNGHKVLQCTYQELIDQLPEYTQSDLDEKLDKNDKHDEVCGQDPNEATETKPLSRQSSSAESDESDSESTLLKHNLARRNGSWSVYSYYGRKAGLLQVGLFIALSLSYGFTTQFSCKLLLCLVSSNKAHEWFFLAIWLKWWSNANETDPNSDLGKYLGVYTVITLLAVLSLGAGCW